MELKSVKVQVSGQAYTQAYDEVVEQVHNRVCIQIRFRISDKVWDKGGDEIMLDRQTVLLYTTHTQTHKRGNTND